MKRDPGKMGSRKYDLLIIGGGISGACVAHDAVLRGISVALVEKKDFGWATSAATSKLIHGGLRYLKNLEFGLVRESLQERRIYEIIAPHMVYPVPFLIPTYENSSNSRIFIYPGMLLYDILSYDKGSLEDPERKVPHFKILSRSQVLSKEPDVNTDNLTGGAIYYDCQLYSSERTTLSFVQSAAKNGADVANYLGVEQLLIADGKVKGARVKDELNGNTYDIEAKVTVNVTGPWADFVSGLGGGTSRKKIVRSEGIHLITRPLVKSNAIVYRTFSGRHFFMIPWRNKTLIGTTDTRYEGDPDKYGVSEKNVLEFIDEINEAHPAGKLTMDDIEFCYGGLRPIVEEETDVEVDVYDKSRRYEIYDHAAKDNLQNFFTVVGGKYTTSRMLAEKLVDKVFEKLGIQAPPCTTAKTPLHGGNIRNWDSFLQEGRLQFREPAEETVYNILHSYGTAAEKVFDIGRQDPKLLEPMTADSPTILAQVLYSVQNEMAVTLEDIVLRRTDVAEIATMSKQEVQDCASLAAGPLGWSEQETHRQVELVWELLASKGIKYPQHTS